MKTIPIGIVLSLGLGLMAGRVQAANYTWINTSSGASDYWTNSANWVGGTYPANIDTAYMTNTIASGAYTNILDTTLGGTLTAMTISNSSAGQAWLIVTNAALNITTFTLGNGGVLEIAHNGVVTNNVAANANWWYGNTGTICLNSGGTNITANAVTIGNAINNVYATVSTTGSSGGTWDLNSKALTIGMGAGTNNTLLVTGSGVVVTNVGITGGRSGVYNGMSLGHFGATASGSSLIISNGGQVVVNSGYALSDLDSSRNRILVDNGTLTAPAYIIGWQNSGAAYGLNNTLMVTNGGIVMATGANGLAVGNGGVGISGYGSSGNSVTVAGTNNAGTKATINLNGGALSIGYSLSGGSLGTPGTNLAQIGSGGIITNGGAVFLGGGAALGNSLVITNGGQLWSGGSAHYIGNGAGTSNNTAQVMGGSGGTSLWSLGGQTLYVGAAGAGNVLRIDGAGVTGGSVVTNGGLFVGYNGGRGNSVLVTNGAQVFLAKDSRVGYASGGTVQSNTLTIVNATYTGGSNRFHVGWADGFGTAAYNQLHVGAGGLMTNVGYVATLNEIDFTVGSVARSTAYSNQMVVTDGGKVFTLGNLTVGRVFNDNVGGSGASSNSLLIANGGLVNVPGRFFLGSDSTNSGYAYAGTANLNSLTITNGGQLITGADSYIGLAQQSGSVMNNNTAMIGGSLNGTNAMWNLGGRNLYVGSRISGTVTGNMLTVSSGGVVTNVASLAISATNTLSLLAGGQIYAGAATNAGTLTVGIDDTVTPACGRLTVSGNLNISGATLNIVTNGAPSNAAYVIVTYDTLVGSFGTTNGLPAGWVLSTNYQGNNIALVQPLPVVAVVNSGTTNQGSGVCTLQGMVTSGGVANAWICWGTNDAGETATSAWQNVASVGAVLQDSAFSTLASPLSTNVTYWYRCFATNAYGTAWASPAAWFNASPASGASVGIGGVVTYTDANGLNPTNAPYANGYVVHTFTNSGTFSNTTATSVEVLVVAGGGGGGYGTGGGGGAGGMLTGTVALVVSNYTVVVGGGGAGASSSGAGGTGTNSSFASYTASGGGGGGGNNGSAAAGAGGSGGGGSSSRTGGSATPAGQGNTGGTGGVASAGGGGGAGEVGQPGQAGNVSGRGGDGLPSAISGTTNYYAQGGCGFWSSPVNNANRGGGGNSVNGVAAQSGTPNTGGGGGGWTGTAAAGSGGSGIVMVRYPYGISSFSIQNLAPTAITNTSAVLNAQLQCPTTNCDIYVHWGPTDGTNNFGAWSSSAHVGLYSNLASTNICFTNNSLAPNTTYYYTFSATNSTTNVWASPSWRFSTPFGLLSDEGSIFIFR